jgi:hypothetical protein
MILVQVNQHRYQRRTLVAVMEGMVAADSECQSGSISDRLWILQCLAVARELSMNSRFKESNALYTWRGHGICRSREILLQDLVDPEDVLNG